MMKHGICPDHLNLTPDAIETMVEGYTRESGVRQLERCVATVCRHAALSLAEALNADFEADCMVDLDLPILVDSCHVKQILGVSLLDNAKIYILAERKVLETGIGQQNEAVRNRDKCWSCLDTFR